MISDTSSYFADKQVGLIARDMEGSIVVRLKGGLGNQLFQYATARAMALRSNVPLKLDVTSGFRNDPFGRSYGLNPFTLKATPASRFESFVYPGGRVVRAASRFFNSRRPLGERSYIQERALCFDPEIVAFRCRKQIYIEGYWQSEQYFADCSEQIRQDFRFMGTPSAQSAQLAHQIEASNSVAVHFRRRRALRLSGETKGADNDTVNANYYSQAFERIARVVRDPTFFLFSDDPDWVRQNIPLNYSSVVVTGNESEDRIHEDLWLMTKCDHHILANSTFSWWGAWLSANGEGTVIAPDKIRFNRDIIPQRWLVLES
ncbi:MAG: alpha-1,2-fucosyltransferase [Deltaproteobacteria bacterium]|nr:alpha-1,2-fucosyltransferase [Deltaproteobacteria bacterium]